MFNKVIFTKGEIKIGFRVYDIEAIDSGKLKDFETLDDIKGNGYKPSDICIKIRFKDGTSGTLKGNWTIRFI